MTWCVFPCCHACVLCWTLTWLAAAGVDADPNSTASAALIPTSPRSIEACFRLGIGE